MGSLPSFVPIIASDSLSEVGDTQEDHLERPIRHKSECRALEQYICSLQRFGQRIWESAERKTRGSSGIDGRNLLQPPFLSHNQRLDI